MNNDNSSGANTILIVIVLLVVVVLAVWFIRGGMFGVPADTDAGNGEIDVNVQLPTGNDEGDGQQ